MDSSVQLGEGLLTADKFSPEVYVKGGLVEMAIRYEVGCRHSSGLPGLFARLSQKRLGCQRPYTGKQFLDSEEKIGPACFFTGPASCAFSKHKESSTAPENSRFLGLGITRIRE
jgi:hypothetical protein